MKNNKTSENIEDLRHTIHQLKKDLENERRRRISAEHQKNELKKENKRLKKEIAKIFSNKP